MRISGPFDSQWWEFIALAAAEGRRANCPVMQWMTYPIPTWAYLVTYCAVNARRKLVLRWCDMTWWLHCFPSASWSMKNGVAIKAGCFSHFMNMNEHKLAPTLACWIMASCYARGSVSETQFRRPLTQSRLFYMVAKLYFWKHPATLLLMKASYLQPKANPLKDYIYKTMLWNNRKIC